ncbi:alpha/beta hydrolase [Streptomyces sp. NPDC051183]|uniref:alpha/beta hydrolase n=1 Tax=Streptomyces sp. NPDC051183 TaxID=3155165 RepID=UPI00343D1198
MVSLPDLRDLRLSELTEAAQGWAEVSNRARAARDEVVARMINPLRDTQRSEAAKGAYRQLDRLRNNFQYVHTEAGLVQAALNGLVEELTGPQRWLTQALQEAQAGGLTVHDDGSVSYPAYTPAEPGAEGEPPGIREGTTATGLFGEFERRKDAKNPYALKAREIADRIARSLEAASAADGMYAASMRKLKAESGLDIDQSTWRDVAGDQWFLQRAANDVLRDDIPRGKSPNERRVWWDKLTQEQRNQYLALYPEIIGNLDGIPSATRDEANRAYLPILIAKLQAVGDPSAATKIDGLLRIQQKLNEGSEPPMFLLAVSAEGNGRAAVAFNNPDTSQNVGVYVPGTNTRLDTSFVSGDLNRAKQIAVEAATVDPNTTTSTIAWLGYDTPQVRGPSWSAVGDVSGTELAEQAAPAFNSFMEGIGATSTYAGPNITAIGHSYGSLVIGEASQQRPGGIPSVDNIVLVGSPGVGVDDAADLRVPKGQVFVGSSDEDIVTKLPSPDEQNLAAAAGLFGGRPDAERRIDLAGQVFDIGDDDIAFGKDPASKAFGAERFPTGPIGHSDYFTTEEGDDQVSGDHIAAIVAGHPERVPRIPLR